MSEHVEQAGGPACSVVVCTHRRPAALAACLAALSELDHPSYEVIVVDNTLGDPETMELATRYGARYVREPGLGLSRARNLGGRVARGRTVAFLDDDVVAGPDWLTQLAAPLEDRAVAATTGRVLAAGLDDPTAREYHAATSEDLGAAHMKLDDADPAWFERANFGGLGTGGNMALRRELFDRGWRFREGLGLGTPTPGCEENYAFFTIMRMGFGIAYVPEAVVHHYGPNKLRDLRRRRRRMMRSGCAYMLLLLVEEPQYRRRLLRYIIEGVRSAERLWRPHRVDGARPGRREWVLAAVWAPIMYGRSRRLESRWSLPG